MSNKNLVLRLLITAKDEASSIFGSLQSKAAAVASAIAAYFSVDFLVGAVKGAADFEAALSRVKAATGASAQEMAALKKVAEDAGANTRFTSVEAAAALEGLAKAGLSANQSMAALPAVMSLAQAGDVSLAESATIVTRTVSGMGVAVEDAGRIADVLAMGANASNTSVRGLAEALSYAGPTARSLGLSMEQTVAYLGKFADAGIDASRAGTALNAILAQFQDPSSRFRTELAAAGITTGSFDKALRQLVVSGAAGEKAILAVGTEAGPALRGLINQGLGALDDLKGKLDGAKGSAAETAETMGANLNGAMKGLESAWGALKKALGEPVLDVATQAAKDLTANLRDAVSNGTITRFGEAFRSAFSGVVEWVKKFSAEVDPAELVAKLQAAAQKTGAWFDALGEKARNAGDIVRTAWGVMGAGVNTVMGGIYKLAEMQAGVWRAMLNGIASVAEGMAKIAPGRIGEQFRDAAAEVRVHAGAMGAVSQAFADKADKAFAAVAEGADLARKGWAGLTAPSGEAGRAVEQVGAAARVSADDLDRAGEGATVTGGKITALGVTAAAAAPGVKAVGDAAKEASKGASDAADAADRLKAAYTAMGLQTSAELNKVAATMKGHWEAIKADGTATPAILEAAFRKYAEAAVAANGGVVAESLKTEAAIRGLTIKADGASVSVSRIGDAGRSAGAGVASGMETATGAVNRLRSDAERAADRLLALKNASLGDGHGNQSTGNGSFEDLRRAGVTAEQMRNAGYSSREIEDYLNKNDQAAPGTVNRTVYSSSADSYRVGVQNGLNNDQAKVFAEMFGFFVEKANAEARSQAQAQGVAFGENDYYGLQKKALQDALDYARANTDSKSVAKAEGTVTDFYGAGRTYTVHLVGAGGKADSIQVSNQASADALVRALREAGMSLP